MAKEKTQLRYVWYKLKIFVRKVDISSIYALNHFIDYKKIAVENYCIPSSMEINHSIIEISFLITARAQWWIRVGNSKNGATKMQKNLCRAWIYSFWTLLFSSFGVHCNGNIKLEGLSNCKNEPLHNIRKNIHPDVCIQRTWYLVEIILISDILLKI